MELYFGIGMCFAFILLILLLFSSESKYLLVSSSSLYLIPVFLIIIAFWPIFILASIFCYIYPIPIDNHRLF